MAARLAVGRASGQRGRLTETDGQTDGRFGAIRELISRAAFVAYDVVTKLPLWLLLPDSCRRRLTLNTAAEAQKAPTFKHFRGRKVQFALGWLACGLTCRIDGWLAGWLEVSIIRTLARLSRVSCQSVVVSSTGELPSCARSLISHGATAEVK